MFNRLNRHMKFTTITAMIGLVLIFVLSIAWSADNDGDDANEFTYSASEVIEMGNGTTIDLVNEGEKIIKIWIDSGALDAYMEEQELV